MYNFTCTIYYICIRFLVQLVKFLCLRPRRMGALCIDGHCLSVSLSVSRA